MDSTPDNTITASWNGFVVRQILPCDLDLICAHREAMFRESGRSEEVLQQMAAPFRRWLEPRLMSGDYFGHVLSDNGQPIAGIGLMLIDWPPHPAHPEQDSRGYVLNVYVDPGYRRRGIARQLMEAGRPRVRRARGGLRGAARYCPREAPVCRSRMGCDQRNGPRPAQRGRRALKGLTVA